MSGTAPVTTGPPLEARTNYQQMKMEARGSASRWGGGGPPPLPPDGSFPPTHRFSPPQTRRCAHTVCKRHSFYCRKHHVYRKSFVTKQIAISLRSLSRILSLFSLERPPAPSDLGSTTRVKRYLNPDAPARSSKIPMQRMPHIDARVDVVVQP